MANTPPVLGLSTFQQNLLSANGDTGIWENYNDPKDNSPQSFCLMPLPQTNGATPSPGFILKNFTYSETLQFSGNEANASPALAPNRGGSYLQKCNALFYDQKVKFAEGPGVNTVVHEENGSWLYLDTGPQPEGPYFKGPDQTPADQVPPQPASITYCKQMSVPHGNSILSLGSSSGVVDASTTPLKIEDAGSPYSTPLDGGAPLSKDVYDNVVTSTAPDYPYPPGYQNPDPAATANVNAPIQKAASQLDIDKYIHVNVTTKKLAGGQGIVTNIPFEERLSDVTDYYADYWLIATKGSSSYDYLLYTQSIIMDMVVNGKHYSFPHITSNALQRTT